MTQIFNQQFLLEQQLGRLAMEFRGCQNAADKKAIARQYEQTVEQLIRTGTWDEVPPPEDLLPDHMMPANFQNYWNDRAGSSKP